MNKEQKKQLEAIAVDIERAETALSELAADLHSEFDELSEKAQEGAKGEALEATIGSLEEAAEYLANARNVMRGGVSNMSTSQTQVFAVTHFGSAYKVRVTVDLDWLAKLYIRRALKNKSRRSKIANGGVVVSVESPQ